MTAIVWKRVNGKSILLVDSFVEKDGEWMEISDKVWIVKQEMKLVSQDGKFEDCIIGITYTGARYAVERLGQALRDATDEMLKSIPDMTKVVEGDPDPIKYTYDVVMRRYEQASDLGLLNKENHFTALLIGAKGAYEANLTAKGLEIEEVKEEETLYMGCGASYMRDLDRRNECQAQPIRMMHFAILMEPGCGGRISQYERVADARFSGGVGLALTGLYEPPDPSQLRVAETVASIHTPPDMIINPKAYNARRRTGEGITAAFDCSREKEGKSEEEQKVDEQARRAEAAADKQPQPKKSTRTRHVKVKQSNYRHK